MGSNRLIAVAAVLTAALLSLGAASGDGAPTRFGQIDDARLLKADSEPQNWLAYGGDHEGHRYSALDQINVSNVAQLKPAWVFDYDTDRGQETTPIVVDGVAFVTSAWSKVYALNAKTGDQIWAYDPKVPGEAGIKPCCDVLNRGAAVYKGKVYVGTIDGRLIALDARTGKLVWSTMTVDPNGETSITGAPRVANGLVFIGNAGGDTGGRGYASAYNAETGKMAWRFWLTPGKRGVKDNAPSDEIMDKLVRPTWFGPDNDYRGGANVWSSIVYDPDLDQVYLATGDGYPWSRWFRSEGKGDNLFIASIVALDAKTGRYKWHYQETPGESWDLDAVADMILVDLPTPNGVRKALLHTPKSGYFYELDRKTGQVISGVPFVPGVTWTLGLDPKTGKPIMNPAVYYDNKTPVRVSPGGAGAHSWHPTSYSPKTGLFYLQARQGPPGVVTPRPTYQYVPGLTTLGTYGFGQAIPKETTDAIPPMPPNPTPARTYLLAWDPVKQKAVWQADGNGGGVLATAGNLVFQGVSRNVMGVLNAYRADTGEKLWSYNTPNAIITGPVSYMVDGEQYIIVPMGAALSAMGGGVDVRARSNGRLVAFKLNGKATLPPDPPPAGPPKPPPVSQVWSAADIAEGSELYAAVCSRCHGAGTRSNNVVPDLTRSNVLANKDGWSAVVEGGLLTPNGMISWAKYMKPGGAEKIRGYVADQARKSLAAAPPRQDAATYTGPGPGL